MSRAVGTSSPVLSVSGLRPEAEALEPVPGWGWQLVCEPGLCLSRAPDSLACGFGSCTLGVESSGAWQ